MNTTQQPEARLLSLYDITGNIADANTMLISVEELRGLHAKIITLQAGAARSQAGPGVPSDESKAASESHEELIRAFREWCVARRTWPQELMNRVFIVATGEEHESAATDSKAARESHGKILKALSAIVCMPSSDDDAIKRDPVMAQVQTIRAQADALIKTALRDAAECVTAGEVPADVGARHPAVVHWRNNGIEACAGIAEAYGCNDAARDMRAMLTALQPPAAAPGVPAGIYVASRASVPERPARWRALREEGWPIVSSWIDEAGSGETDDVGELWARIAREVASAKGVLLYVESNDFPLRGALIEVGMALSLGKRVGVYAPGVALEERSKRPLGSWVTHPLVRITPTLQGARDWIEAALQPPAADQEPVAQTSLAAPGCELGCSTECKAKQHGCASECPALPWQPTAAPAAGVRSDAVAKRRASYLRQDTDAGRAFVAQFFKASGSNVFDDYIHTGLAGDFACELASILAAAGVTAGAVPDGWRKAVQRGLDSMRDAVRWRETGIGRPPEQTCMDAIAELQSLLAAAPRPPATAQEPVDEMGIPLSCGKPLCSPGDHHPLCKLYTQPSPLQAVPAVDERAAFEADWLKRHGVPMNTRMRDDGRYGDHLIQCEWEAWQARAVMAEQQGSAA